MRALKNCTWRCGNNIYELVIDEVVKVKKEDMKQAEASGLFEVVKRVK